jgi:hypothetical protein
MTKGVEGGDAGAEERGGFLEIQSVGIASVIDDAGDLSSLAYGEFSPAARLTNGTMAADPADADALSLDPVGDAFTESIDDPCDFVARDAGIRDSGKKIFLSDGIAVADTAGRHFHANLARAGIGDGAVYNFNGSVCESNLCNAHGWHIFMMHRSPVTTQKLEIVIFLSIGWRRLAASSAAYVGKDRA